MATRLTDKVLWEFDEQGRVIGYQIGMQKGTLTSVVGSLARGVKAPQPAVGDKLSLADVTVLSGAPTVSLTTGPNGMPAIKIETGVGAACDLAIPGMVNGFFHGEAFICAHGDRSTGLDYFTFYVGDGTAGGYGNGYQSFLQYGLVNPSSSSFEQQGANTYHLRKATFTQINVGPAYPMPIGAAKFRVQPLGGQKCTVFLYGIGIAAPARKGRICVSIDDGYDSWFRLGFDSLASRGIKQTMSIIGSVQGTGGGYSNVSQLRAFVDAGNAVVAHGPWPSDAQSQNSNVVDLYAATADPVGNAVNDARLARQWILDQGLGVPNFDRCYVWPQGKFQAFNGDLRYLDAFIAAGFTCARNVGNLIGSAQPAGYNFDALSKYNRMALPIIGHTWAGTTVLENGADGTSNTAGNIFAIKNAIAALGTHRTDAFLMFHRVLPNNTNDVGMGAAGNITIRQQDLELIAAAIKTQVDNGVLETVTMPELAINGWWQQF